MVKLKRLNVFLSVDESLVKEYKRRGFVEVEAKKKTQPKKSEPSK